MQMIFSGHGKPLSGYHLLRSYQKSMMMTQILFQVEYTNWMRILQPINQ